MATERQIDLSPGNPNYFGIKDYKANRPYFSNLQIKEYLDANRGVVNAYGGEQLYNKIAGIGTPGTGWGRNKSKFGKDDLAFNRNLGWTDREIGDYLRANQGVLADHNRTGFQAPNEPGYRNTILQDQVGSSNANWWTALNSTNPKKSEPEPVAANPEKSGPAATEYYNTQGSSDIGTTASGVKRKYSPAAKTGASSLGTKQLNRLFINQAVNV